MELSERKLKILQAIVDDFIFSAEPVGSRTLSKKHDMGISPATIRNEMSDLEEMGYLTHPHTSAGRIPSDKAYRLYVNSLMERYELPAELKHSIQETLNENIAELDRTIEKAARILSDMTNLTSFAIMPKQDQDKLKYINVLPVNDDSVVLMIVTNTGKVTNTVLRTNIPYTEEKLDFLSKVLTHNYKGKELSSINKMDIIKDLENDMEAMNGLVENIMPNFMRTLENMLNVELYMDGLTNIFSVPEFNDIDKAKLFLERMTKKDEIADVLVKRDDGVMITIGNENSDLHIPDCSLITATYHINGKFVGKLGVIGPTRMNYDKVTSIIEYVTENLNRSFKITGDSESNDDYDHNDNNNDNSNNNDNNNKGGPDQGRWG